MALYAFDGTGNADRDGDDNDSNVLDFFRGYVDAAKNDDPKKDRGSLYLTGIGLRAHTKIGELIAEEFGVGGHNRVKDALERLRANVAGGDSTIDVVGFSRGAALAVSFANEVAKHLPALSIRFIGVWDIVGQFGAPGTHVQAGHNLSMPRNVQRCYHAMALDETRELFPLTRLRGTGRDEETRLVEVWFRGVHSDVGGGNGNRGLNWIALNWMFANAMREGLPIFPGAVAANLIDKDLAQQISDHKIDMHHKRHIFATDVLHATVKLIAGISGRPHNNPSIPLARMDDEGALVPAS